MKIGYKHTDIGIIPIDWDVQALQDICHFRRGSFPQPYGLAKWYDDINGMPFVQVYDVDDNGLIKAETKRMISKEAQEYSVFASKGKLILTIQGSIGRIAITQYDAFIDRTLLIFESYKLPIDLGYFSLSIKELFKREEKNAPGGIIKTITKEALSSFLIPLPPTLAEQTAIATALSDMDNLISGLEQLIAKKKNIKQGAMQELLRPKEGWVVKKLGDSADIFRGGSPRPIESYLTNDPDGINWIKIGDVGKFAKYIENTEEKIKPEGVSRSRFVNEGDFLLSNSMSFGRPYILKTNGCIHDGWLVIQNYEEHFDRGFLYYVLGSESILVQYRSMASGSSVLNLNKEIVKNVLINCPKSLDEQAEIATVLSEMDDEIILLESNFEKYNMLKQGMMQELLTGKTRLV